MRLFRIDAFTYAKEKKTSHLCGMAIIGLALVGAPGCGVFDGQPSLDPEDARYGDRDDDDEGRPRPKHDHDHDQDGRCEPPDTGHSGDTGEPGECDVELGPVCDESGHEVQVLDWGRRETDSGPGTFITYQVCAPDLGVCSGNERRSCSDDDACEKHDEGTCSRDCSVDKFHDLSNYQVEFPVLGDSCLDEETVVRGICSDGEFELGDGSCHEGGSSAEGYVAKCDGTELDAGDCLEMTVWIGSEDLYLDETTVIAKAGRACHDDEFAGLACEGCPPEVPDTGDTDETGDSGEYCPEDVAPECLPSGHTVAVSDWGDRNYDGKDGSYIRYEICAPVAEMVCENGGQLSQVSCTEDSDCQGNGRENATCVPVSECDGTEMEALPFFQTDLAPNLHDCLGDEPQIVGACGQGVFELDDTPPGCGELDEFGGMTAQCSGMDLQPGDCTYMSVWYDTPGLGLDRDHVMPIVERGECDPFLYAGLACDGVCADVPVDTSPPEDTADTGDVDPICPEDFRGQCDSLGDRIRVLDWGDRHTNEHGDGTFITYEVCAPPAATMNVCQYGDLPSRQQCRTDDDCELFPLAPGGSREGRCVEVELDKPDQSAWDCPIPTGQDGPYYSGLNQFDVMIPADDRDCFLGGPQQERATILTRCDAGQGSYAGSWSHEEQECEGVEPWGDASIEGLFATCDSFELGLGDCMTMTVWVDRALEVGRTNIGSGFDRSGQRCSVKADPQRKDKALTYPGLVCDGCVEPPACPDADADTVCDSEDVCPGADDLMDRDGDNVPDRCDSCPAVPSRQPDGCPEDTDVPCVTSDCIQ